MSSKAKRRRPQQKPVSGAVDFLQMWPVIAMGIVAFFFAAIRFRLRAMPLERDEGEYAYAGQLILQGIAPYKLAYNMKLPGTYAAYSMLMTLFGQTPTGIHLGLIVVNVATIILIFLLARRLFGGLAGFAAGSSYAALSTSESVLGFQGHATHFVLLAAVGGILVMLWAIEAKRPQLYFWSGVLLGLAFLCKQPGLLFVVFAGIYLIACEWRALRGGPGIHRIAIYSAGAFVPYALMCVLLWYGGALGKMWFWTFSYARQYATVTNLWDGWRNLFVLAPGILQPTFLLWILAAIGLVGLAWDSETRKHALFTVGFLLFSWAAVCAGLFFRPHYFILILPALSLLVGVTVSAAVRELRRLSNSAVVAAIPGIAFVVVLVITIIGQGDVMFSLNPVEVCRQAYGKNPFPEAEVISDYLHREMKEDQRVVVLGSEPEIYFCSKRHSATGYIYVYALMEAQPYALQMQQEMAKEIESSAPEYVVLVKNPASWLPQANSNPFILHWLNDYVKPRYQIVGIADQVDPETRYIWGDAAKTYQEESEAAVEVFKRNPS